MTIFPLIFALALMPSLQASTSLPLAPTPLALPARTNTTYIAVTDYDLAGLESDFSAELVITNNTVGTNRASSVTVGWDPKANVGGYNVYWGPSSRNYTQEEPAGTATNYTIVLVKPVTNGVAFFIQEGTTLLTWWSSTNFPGVLRITNGTAGQRFLRAAWTNWSL